MTTDLTLRIPPTLDALATAADETTAFLEGHSAPSDVVFAANLAIEELVTNSIKYATGATPAGEIVIRLALKPGEVHIAIEDGGQAFNPFDQPEPDTSLPAGERPIGGLGIHFVRHLLDSCTYRRSAGRNIVSLIKKWPVPDA